MSDWMNEVVERQWSVGARIRAESVYSIVEVLLRKLGGGERKEDGIRLRRPCDQVELKERIFHRMG